MKPLPRIMAIHDLSCAGKCSLTVALPILSALGAEVCPLPTAILSTHTGGLSGYTNRDLTEDMPKITAHWRALGLRFDALYSGWLGSYEQAEIVSTLFDEFPAFRLVDPVMGDHGKLYKTYTPDRVAGMAALCARADLITPNLTEACFLLGEPYKPDPSPEEARVLCERLCALGARQVVVTGVLDGDRVGAAAYDSASGCFSIHTRPKVEGIWHGTGDVFCAALLGAMLRGRALGNARTRAEQSPAPTAMLYGRALGDAADIAVRFTHDAIARTFALGTDPRFGVDFERGLPALIEATR